MMLKKTPDHMTIRYATPEALRLYDAVQQGAFRALRVLKDDARSYVALVESEAGQFVYKIPREKNRRKWQRFLSIFRGSQSLREYQNISGIKDLGFLCATPLAAAEKRRGPFVTDSFFLYSWIEGRQATAGEAQDIAKILRKIHDLGYLHGDSQLENFVVNESEQNKSIFLIDTRFRRNIYGKFGAAYEILYLKDSCHEENIHFEEEQSFFIKEPGFFSGTSKF
ncbi:MAG: lipopolysaccharide biosynthesis protein [Fusobacteriaceae bacterium]|jgi:heptose II phosphotransferase|nr:lipopolysaccharide biosynthesis protein [Fusobacteriaceae bacterium]